MRELVVAELQAQAADLGAIAGGSEWYLFGSVDQHSPFPSDIDVLIVCIDDQQADVIREQLEGSERSMPLDLTLVTFEEAIELNIVRLQCASRIF